MNPTPAQIKAERLKHGLTQLQAATLINCHLNTWNQYETGKRAMHLAFFELFVLKANRMSPPSFGVVKKIKKKKK